MENKAEIARLCAALSREQIEALNGILTLLLDKQKEIEQLEGEIRVLRAECIAWHKDFAKLRKQYDELDSAHHKLFEEYMALLKALG